MPGPRTGINLVRLAGREFGLLNTSKMRVRVFSLKSVQFDCRDLRSEGLVHQVSDWGSGAAANFDWMREAKRENTRCGL
jgi:hypothetical protein